MVLLGAGDELGACGGRAHNGGDGGVVVGVGDDDHGRGRLARGDDLVEVGGDQQVARLDLVAGGDVGLEGLALELDGVDTVEKVNDLVSEGVPFRDAYRKVAASVADGSFEYSGKLSHTHEGSIGNLCNDKIAERMEKLISGFGFDIVEAAIKALLSF